MFTYETTVRFNDCDPMGHVNNTVYFTYYEEARVGIFKIFNPSLDLAKWNLIVASTGNDFIHQVVPAEKLTVYTWIGRIGNSSLEVQHAIQNEHGNWVARGKAMLIHFDFATQRAMPIPADIREQLTEHTSAPAGVPDVRV